MSGSTPEASGPASGAASPGAGPEASSTLAEPSPVAAIPAPPASSVAVRWLGITVGVLACLATAALVTAWNGNQRLRSVERELARRQQDSQAEAVQATTLASNANDQARDAQAKVALLQARIEDGAVTREQLDELARTVSRSRDGNVLAEVDASLRLAAQHGALTGNPEPLVTALSQAAMRLDRLPAPTVAVDRVLRAVRSDLERARAAVPLDVTGLSATIDELTRIVDELPATTAADGARSPTLVDERAEAQAHVATVVAGNDAPSGRAAAELPADSAPPGAVGSGTAGAQEPGWFDVARAQVLGAARKVGAAVALEMRRLFRVTRVDVPDAALLAPDQIFLVRENLKLRLLNARLALLGRQFDAAQADLRDARALLQRWFDQRSARVIRADEMLAQVASAAKPFSLPTADASLSAIAQAQAADAAAAAAATGSSMLGGPAAPARAAAPTVAPSRAGGPAATESRPVTGARNANAAREPAAAGR